MMRQAYPLLEFDPNAKAVIEPSSHVDRLDDVPEHCVICFFYDVVDHLREQGRLREIASISSSRKRAAALWGMRPT